MTRGSPGYPAEAATANITESEHAPTCGLFTCRIPWTRTQNSRADGETCIPVPHNPLRASTR